VSAFPLTRPVFVINIGPEGTGLAGFIDATSKVCALFALWPWARHTINASNTVSVLRGMVGAMARSQQFTCPEFDAAGLIYSLRKSVAPKTHLMLPGSLLGPASGLKTYPLRDIGRVIKTARQPGVIECNPTSVPNPRQNAAGQFNEHGVFWQMILDC